MKQQIVLGLVLVVVGWMPLVSWSHEGHNKTPGALTAPHGGQIKGTDHLYMELVAESEGVKLYPLDHDLKPVALGDVKIEGSLQLPRNKKAEPLQWTPVENYYTAKVTAKGAHRYNVELKVSYKNKTEKFNFTVEPQ